MLTGQMIKKCCEKYQASTLSRRKLDTMDFVGLGQTDTKMKRRNEPKRARGNQLEKRQTDRQTDRKTDRQIERQTDRQTDKQTDKQTDREVYSQAFERIEKFVWINIIDMKEMHCIKK